MKTELPEDVKENVKHWCAGFSIQKADPNKRNSKVDHEAMKHRRVVEEHQWRLAHKEDFELGLL